MLVSPEERAKAVMAWLRQECSDAICTYLDCPSCGCMAYLAQAIRDAEDAALERAAAIADGRSSEHCESDWELGSAQSAETIASDIRALKHSKETQA